MSELVKGLVVWSGLFLCLMKSYVAKHLGKTWKNNFVIPQNKCHKTKQTILFPAITSINSSSGQMSGQYDIYTNHVTRSKKL